MMRVQRLSNPQIHPSGDYIAYSISIHDPDANKVNHSIMLYECKTQTFRNLTPGSGSHTNPSWSHDGSLLAFISDRNDGQQIWLLPFLKGGEAMQLTTGKGGCSSPVWSKDDNRIIFSRKVLISPFCESNDLSELKEQEEHAQIYGLANNKSKAKIESSLLFRHWDHWRSYKRSHLFLVDTRAKKPTDITPGDHDVPPISLGSQIDYDFAPEGYEVAYIMNPDDQIATSTNNSLFIQNISDFYPEGKPINISQNKAMEAFPRYSPDKKYLAYLGAERPGYEADRMRIKLYNRQTESTTTLTENFDRTIMDIVWSSDSQKIFFRSPDLGFCNIFSIAIESGKIEQYSEKTFNSTLKLFPNDDILVLRESASHPADLMKIQNPKGCEPKLTLELQSKSNINMISGKRRALTNHNRWLYDEFTLNSMDEFIYPGADDDLIHGFLLKPPGFDPDKKYPTVFLIHGGPQAAFFDNFHYRWNTQLFASPGYIVVSINPRGSIGYGQKFTDQISQDWGGRAYTDLMKGFEYCINQYKFIDKDHLAAAGASFGGFMVNWIQGHTDMFRVLVSHDGIFNAETMAYMTEELWFELWEYGKMPHEGNEVFLKNSPHKHVQNFKTPMLVIQGEQDFRCTVSEGISLFTALQYMKVPSKLLYFPDEGHWVLKPANAEVWYKTVLEFIAEFI